MVAFLARGGQMHLVPLVSHLSPYDPAFQQMFQRLQGNLALHTHIAMATQQTYGTIYGMAFRQAMLLSYIDNFRLLAILCALCVPTAFLFKRVKTGKKPPAGVH